MLKYISQQASYDPLTASPLHYNEKIKLLTYAGYFYPEYLLCTIKLRENCGGRLKGKERKKEKRGARKFLDDGSHNELSKTPKII